MLSSAGFCYHCTDHTTTEDRDWTAGRRPGFWHRLAGSGALGGGQGQEAVVGPRAQTQTLLPPLSSFATLDQALGTSVAQFPARSGDDVCLTEPLGGWSGRTRQDYLERSLACAGHAPELGKRNRLGAEQRAT